MIKDLIKYLTLCQQSKQQWLLRNQTPDWQAKSSSCFPVEKTCAVQPQRDHTRPAEMCQTLRPKTLGPPCFWLEDIDEKTFVYCFIYEQKKILSLILFFGGFNFLFNSTHNCPSPFSPSRLLLTGSFSSIDIVLFFCFIFVLVIITRKKNAYFFGLSATIIYTFIFEQLIKLNFEITLFKLLHKHKKFLHLIIIFYSDSKL